MKKSLFIFILILAFSTNLFSKEIEIVSEITGEGLKIENHFKVHVNYRGFLENGTEFDNSYKRKKPFIFQIGLRQVILGWDKGLMGMRVGGKRTIKIPPDLAYGTSGVGNTIPPNATLIFEVEIVNAFRPNYSKINSDTLIKKQKKGLILVDIRTEKERQKTGIIKGSLEMTAFDLKGNFKPNFINDYQATIRTDDHVVFISNKGEISSILANGFVEKLKSKHMYSLIGGIQNWIKEGKKLNK